MDGQVDKVRETQRVRRRDERRTDQGEEEGELHGGVILVIKRAGYRPRERRDRDRKLDIGLVRETEGERQTHGGGEEKQRP